MANKERDARYFAEVALPFGLIIFALFALPLIAARLWWVN